MKYLRLNSIIKKLLFLNVFLQSCSQNDSNFFEKKTFANKPVSNSDNSVEQAEDFYITEEDRLREAGNDEGALELYNKGIELYPDFAVLFYKKATLLLDNEEYEESLENFNKALDLDPENYDCLYNKALLLEGLEENEEALSCCNIAIELNDKRLECKQLKLRILDSLGREEEAMKLMYDLTS